VSLIAAAGPDQRELGKGRFSESVKTIRAPTRQQPPDTSNTFIDLIERHDSRLNTDEFPERTRRADWQAV